MKKIYVFYDGKCGVCSKEINYYKKVDLKKSFVWIDVNKEKEKLEKYNITYNESLMFLHLIDKEGHVRIGVEAFLTIWNELRYWKFIALLLNVKPIKFLMKICYNFWAKKRYAKLDYRCDI